MKIQSIGGFNYLKIMPKKTQVSFKATDESKEPLDNQASSFLVAKIKLQAAMLQKESKANQKLAKAVLDEARFVQNDLQRIESTSQQNLQRADEIIESGILDRAINGFDRFIPDFILIKDADPKTRTQTFYSFDGKTKKIIACYINAKMDGPTLTAEQAFFYKGGKLTRYAEGYLRIEKLARIFEKSLKGYSFKNKQEIEYFEDFEECFERGGKGSKLGRAFLFHDTKLKYYAEDKIVENGTGYAKVKTQINYNEAEQMFSFIKGEYREPSDNRVINKSFYYNNGILFKVLLNSERPERELISSERSFEFLGKNSFKCNFDEVQKGTSVNCSNSLYIGN